MHCAQGAICSFLGSIVGHVETTVATVSMIDAAKRVNFIVLVGGRGSGVVVDVVVDFRSVGAAVITPFL